MRTKKQVKEIIRILKEAYPEAKCSLDFSNSFECTIAVLLSAQCTDERVNIVTPELFAKASSAEEMNKLSQEEIEKYIKTCGLYKSKAKNIKKLSEIVVREYAGKIPKEMEKLIELPGVGRKTANVVMLEAFNNPQGVAIDTHAKRICNRIGISKEEDPNKVEKDLLRKIDVEQYKDANHLFVHHGRAVCKARKAECNICPINELCEYGIKELKGKNNGKIKIRIK